MAITYTKEALQELDVVSRYKELMKAATSRGSIYIKSKETLDELLKNSAIDEKDRASIVANMIGNMATSMSSQALQIAVDIEKDKRDSPYTLAKLREDTKMVSANILKQEVEVAKGELEKNLLAYNGWKIQGDLVRTYGIDAFNLTTATEIVPVGSYDVSGEKYESIRAMKANTYNTYASSWRTNGYVSVPVNADGTLTSQAAGNQEGLVHAQTNVAVRQEQGFDDNMRQHVANSSSSMISLLLSTEASGIDYTPYLASWTNAITYLNTSANEVAGTITTTVIPVSVDISAGNATISGTTVNIKAGSGVELVITDGTSFSTTVIAIVQLDGTWSGTFDSSDLAGLVAATGNVTASVLDNTGRLRSDIDAVTLVA